MKNSVKNGSPTGHWSITLLEQLAATQTWGRTVAIVTVLLSTAADHYPPGSVTWRELLGIRQHFYHLAVTADYSQHASHNQKACRL